MSTQMLDKLHGVSLEIWALTFLLHGVREALNEGKTAPHQSRSTEAAPEQNGKVTRAGIFAEVLFMSLLRELNAPEAEQRYIQDGMLHEDIRDADHKGQPDLYNGVDIKCCRLFRPTDKGYSCNINSRKHHQMKSNGLTGYYVVVAAERSQSAYISRMLTPSEVEAWDFVERDDRRGTGNDFYSAHIDSFCNISADRLFEYAWRTPEMPMYSVEAIVQLAQDGSFHDKMVAQYPYIKWDLVRAAYPHIKWDNAS